MLNWQKTNHRHALNTKYSLFIQLSRRRNWLWEDPRVKKTIDFLRKTYGDDTTRMNCVDENGAIYMRRFVPSEHWYVDRARRRIYIKDEKSLTLMALMAVA